MARHRHSGIAKHRRHSKKLIAPFNDLEAKLNGAMVFQSWIDNRIPDIAWMALARGGNSQGEFISKCHILLNFIHDNEALITSNSGGQPTHSDGILG